MYLRTTARGIDPSQLQGGDVTLHKIIVCSGAVIALLGIVLMFKIG